MVLATLSLLSTIKEQIKLIQLVITMAQISSEHSPTMAFHYFIKLSALPQPFVTWFLLMSHCVSPIALPPFPLGCIQPFETPIVCYLQTLVYATFSS